MILKPQSILRYLPKELEKRTLLILDTIRFTIEMIDKSWFDLISMLEFQSTTESPRDLPAMFLYVWSIIDNSQRFINIIELLPSESGHSIVNDIRHIKSIRNTFAHLNERVDKPLIETNSPFYGALTWEFKNEDTKKIEVFIAISGIEYGTKHNYNFSKYDQIDKKIFNVKLETVNRREKLDCNIEKLILDLKQIIKKLENDLEEQFSRQNLQRVNWEHIRDILIVMKNE